LDLSLPCKKLCKKPLHRPHLTCLTCLDRRYYYGKVDRELYVHLEEKREIMFVAPHSPMTLPKNVRLYYLLINCNGGTLKQKVKGRLLKPLLSLAELIANW